jgi:hypothetical protein
MIEFSDSIKAHCRLLRSALVICKCECSEEVSGLAHAAATCGHKISKSLNMRPPPVDADGVVNYQYDTVIWLEEANFKEGVVAGAVFMKAAGGTEYEIMWTAVPDMADTRELFYILQCLAAEAAGHYGRKLLKCRESSERCHNPHLVRMNKLLGFYWFDAEGNPSGKLSDFQTKKAKLAPCYKVCRPLFPHSRVYFASCLPRPMGLGVIITNGGHGDDGKWDIYLEYGGHGRATMRKTETGYEVHALEVDAAHVEKGKSLAREAAVYDSGRREGLELAFFF